MGFRMKKSSKTVVGEIRAEVLAYTAGKDYKLDHKLVAADCFGSAAHARMLFELPLEKRIFSATELESIIRELGIIMKGAAAGEFRIGERDQDVHLAIERVLTGKLGDLGKKIHTARSRNDQIALDLRIFARGQLLAAIEEAGLLAQTLARFADRHSKLPMVGRTHMQPAMPSSVGLWAGAYAEGLLGDIDLLWEAYRQNDCSPLGSAASYGVPIPIDRRRVAELLGFPTPCGNVLNAANMRGKLESIILGAMSQAMLTLSRLAQDLILFSMPEFGYFRLPPDCCTGSSIMPQKNNPDVLELLRARTAVLQSHAGTVFNIVQSSPSGYNRDLQEAKEPFLAGIEITRQSLRIMKLIFAGIEVDRERLLAAFTPEVFATDRALELVAEGMPFRDAYHHVKGNLAELEDCDPVAAINAKTHLGAPCGIDFKALEKSTREQINLARRSERKIGRRLSKLIGQG